MEGMAREGREPTASVPDAASRARRSVEQLGLDRPRYYLEPNPELVRFEAGDQTSIPALAIEQRGLIQRYTPIIRHQQREESLQFKAKRSEVPSRR